MRITREKLDAVLQQLSDFALKELGGNVRLPMFDEGSRLKMREILREGLGLDGSEATGESDSRAAEKIMADANEAMAEIGRRGIIMVELMERLHEK